MRNVSTSPHFPAVSLSRQCSGATGDAFMTEKEIATTTPIDPLQDRRRTLAVAEDAQRIASLARELQRNALELEGQSHKLRGTLEALESANETLDRRTREIAEAQATACLLYTSPSPRD